MKINELNDTLRNEVKSKMRQATAKHRGYASINVILSVDLN